MNRFLNVLALCFLAFLAGCTLVFGYFTVKVFTDPVSTYSPDDVVEVTGRINRMERSPVVQLWVEGQELPFRGLWWTHEEVEELQRHEGEPVKVGVPRTEQATPLRDHRHGQDFRNIYSLEINGRTVLSLDQFNRASARNAVGLRIFVPVMLLCSIGVWVWMIAQRHKPSPKLGEAPPRFLLDYVGVGVVLGILAAALLGINGWDGKGWAGRWAGSGFGGLFLGIAGGFAFGLSLAALLGAVAVFMSRVAVWAEKSKRRSVVLTITTLLASGATLVYLWEDHSRLVVFLLIAWPVVILCSWAVRVSQVAPSTESGGETAGASDSWPK
jgi:hypothetical protein